MDSAVDIAIPRHTLPHDVRDHLCEKPGALRNIQLPRSNLSLCEGNAAPIPCAWNVASRRSETIRIANGCFVACNDSIMATEQLQEICSTDSQRFRALGVALGYKSRVFWLYQDHPLDYSFVMLFQPVASVLL